MKLLIYSHFFAPSIGGVETIVMSLACGLADLRAKDGSPEFLVTLVTQTARGDFDDGKMPFLVIRKPDFGQLSSLIRRADVVHIAGPSLLPMLLAQFMPRPFVVEHHGYQSICPNGLLIHQPERSVCTGHFQARNYVECWKCQYHEVSKTRALINVLAAFPRHALAQRAAANITVSEHVLQRLQVPRSSVVYHGIEAAPEIRTSSSNQLLQPKRICFAYVGRFVAEKGLPVFIEALGHLRKQGLEFEAKLIGDGPERPKIESQIAAAQLSSLVKVTGYLSGNALAETVDNVSVVVMPSVCEETAGLAAMEQMMRGRLVICSDIGGLSEIVGDAGMKFPVGDARALAECLRRVIEGPLLIKELSEKAHARARELFVRSQMIEGHASVYQNLLAKQQK